MTTTSPAPPAAAEVDGRLRYRLLTGTDDRAFCEKVSAALAQGYVLHGSPSIAHDGQRTVTAQAVVLPQQALDGALDVPSGGTGAPA